MTEASCEEEGIKGSFIFTSTWCTNYKRGTYLYWGGGTLLEKKGLRKPPLLFSPAVFAAADVAEKNIQGKTTPPSNLHDTIVCSPSLEGSVTTALRVFV